MRIPLLFALVLGGTTVAAAATAETLPPGAQVTLPFAEVRTLIEAAAGPPAPPPPPVASVLLRADLAADFTRGGVMATLETEVLGQGWQIVPLLGTELGLVEVQPPETTVVARDGYLSLLTRETGRRKITLRFTAGARDPLTFRIPPLSAGRLTAEGVPSDRTLNARWNGRAVPLPLTLPATGGEISLALAEPTPPSPPTRWQSVTRETLVTARPDRLALETRITLRAEAGDATAAEVTLPTGAAAVQASGPDLHAAQPRGNRLPLAWATPGVRDRSFVLRYELPLPADSSWLIEPPSFPAGEVTARTVLVPSVDAVLASEEASPAPIADLPAWMRAALAAGGPPMISRVPGAIRALAQPLPRLAVDTARVPEASYRTRVVPDGARLTEAELSIHHRGPLRWRFALPAGAELLACEVDGRPVSPLVRTDALELPLAAEPDAAATTRITFSYTERGERIAPVEGRLDVALPLTPLFVEQLAWAITLPPGYDPTAFEGNVESRDAGKGLAFQKRLVRNEAPAVEIHYRKQDASL